MWKSSRAISDLLEEIPNTADLEKFYSLSIMWRNAAYPCDYSADPEWTSLLTFSREGEELLTHLRGDIQPNEPDLYLALFMMFNHHDLIFSHELSNLDGILSLLEKETLSNKIKFPYRFGRALYDKFHEFEHFDRANHLLPQDVDALLKDTPKGVYQVGNLTLGPLGVVYSAEPRSIYPELKLPLWHCADTGCNTVHIVDLVRHQPPVERIFSAINRKGKDLFGPSSEWKAKLKWLHREGRWENGRKYSDLIETIGDCIVGKERTALTAHALKGASKLSLRQIITTPPRKKSNGDGSPEDVAQRLTSEEQLQLLMSLEDNILVEYIDELTDRRSIKIPLGDVRKPEFSATSRAKDQRCQLSALGIRSYRPNPISNLSALILQAYESENMVNELAWKLRQAGGKNLREALFNHIRDKGPETSVRELVLSSAALTKTICNEVSLSLKHISSNDKKSVEKILWKLGFNPADYSDTLKRLKVRLSDFNQKLLSTPSIDTEDDREGIRSAGVNLFVSLEEFLDSLISYNVWLLYSDHFASNRFSYDIDEARHCVSQALSIPNEDEMVVVPWSENGDNTLGTLLYYLARTASWIESLEDANRDQLKKDEDDLPHYYDDKLRPFPFRHTQLWADADVSELSKYKDGFITIARLIGQADLASVRNGIDHHRDEYSFPESDKMFACVARLSQALESADVNRYFPKQFWLESKKENRYGVREYTYLDYADRELITFGPNVAMGLPNQIYAHPVIIAPGNLLGYPNSQLMFWIQERNEYSNFWRDYPKRRKPEPARENELLGSNSSTHEQTGSKAPTASLS